MKIQNHILKDMPFPYLIISKQYQITASSIPLQVESFTELIAEEGITLDHIFCATQSSFKVKLRIEDFIYLYHVYFVQDGDYYHLYCFPLSPSMDKYMVEQNHAEKLNIVAAGIVHEIRNPLTTVKGFLQLLQPELMEIGKETYAELAISELERANDILSEFLNTAKPRRTIICPISLNKLMKNTFLLFKSEATLKNVHLSIQLADEELFILGNDKEIKQVLLNLLSNALAAINTGDESKDRNIQIKLLKNNNYASIHIRDTGIGMSKEMVEKLFTPYYSTKETGTGLGLAISKQIVEKHKGKVTVQSEEGAGTTIKIEMPLITQTDCQ